MTVDFGAVEDCVRRYRERLQEEKEELVCAQEEVERLTSALSQQFSERSVPGHLNALFGEEEKDFFPFQEDERRRRRLAQERREEYNAFLQRKDEAQQVVQKRIPEKAVTPRSILESVDYEKVLAKRKAEEAEFRNLNYAVPSLDRSTSIPSSPVKKYPQEETKRYPQEEIKRYPQEEIKRYPQEENKRYLQEENKRYLQEENKRYLQEENKRYPQEENKRYPQEENKRYPQEENKRYPQEENKRTMIHAEPSLDRSSSISASLVKKYPQEEYKSSSTIPNGEEYHHTNNYSAKRENDTSRPQSSGKKISHSAIGFINGERRGGGGEPLRDSSGNIIATRGYVTFPSELDNSMKNRQVSYREELRRQIEAKQALEAEKRRRLAEEDEAIERRSEEQRLRMQREYEEEQRRTQRNTEQRDRERLRKLEEFQMREAALRQKRAPPPEPRVAEVPIVQEVEAEGGRKSPPIPTVRSMTILNSAPPQPILTEVKPENVFSSLSEIRKSLMQQQPKKDFKNSYEVSNRRTVLEDEEEAE